MNTAESDLHIEQLPDDCLRLTMRRDGIEASCVVSSWHLAEEKRQQLLAAIERSARNAYTTPPHA